MKFAPKRLLVMFVVPAAVALTVATPSAHATGQVLQVWLTKTDGTANLAQQSSITLGAVSSGANNVVVNDSLRYQTYTGVGAAFTDSSAYLLDQLRQNNPTAYTSAVNSLFTSSAADGAGISIVRIPMGSSDFIHDFSQGPWTDDNAQGPSNDPTANFALTAEDLNVIIPRIKDALAANSSILTIASPWTAPKWMKTDTSTTSGQSCYWQFFPPLYVCNPNTLNSNYYQAWADYFRKWIQAYQGQGVTINAITPQNEPLNQGIDPGMPWPSESAMDSWIHTYLAPTLRNAGLTPEALGWDHNWDNETYAAGLLGDTTGSGGDLGGIGWHCYDDNGFGTTNAFEPAAMTQLHNLYPNKDVYETECTPPWGFNTYLDGTPGSGDSTHEDPGLTAKTLLLSFQNWAKGALEWNIALNPTHGPDYDHQNGCTADPAHGTFCSLGLLKIDPSNWTVTRNNAFYQLAQIGHFVVRGATHIASTVNANGIVTAAFQNPNGQEVLIANNTTGSPITFTTTWNGQGSFTYQNLPAGATATFVGTVAAAPVLSATPSAGHVYRIVSKTSGKPFGVWGASTSNGGQVVQWTDNGRPEQQWRLASAGTGISNLVNVNSGMALDNNSSTSNGTAMQQYTITGPGNQWQQWRIIAQADGYYTIQNVGSGDDLNVRNGDLQDYDPSQTNQNPNNTAYIQQWAPGSNDPNQEWQFVPVS